MFCLNSGIVLKIGNIIPIIASDRIIKIVEDCGKKSRRGDRGKGIDICNKNKAIFGWENEELEEYSGVVEKEGGKHQPGL